MKKVRNGLKGLALTLTNIKILNADQFKAARIAIVGPANSAHDEHNGKYIDEFDVVIRINKAASVVASGKHELCIGKKTTVLFNSFFENEESGGGPLDLKLFADLGIKFLVNPRSTISGQRNTFNFFKKYVRPWPVYTLPVAAYSQICKPLKGFRPTIGYTALSYVIQYVDFAELFITGFTFYRTPFAQGYRDHMQSPEKVRNFMANQGLHDVDLEFKTFVNLVNATNKQIRFDLALTDILKNEKQL